MALMVSSQKGGKAKLANREVGGVRPQTTGQGGLLRRRHNENVHSRSGRARETKGERQGHLCQWAVQQPAAHGGTPSGACTESAANRCTGLTNQEILLPTHVHTHTICSNWTLDGLQRPNKKVPARLPLRPPDSGPTASARTEAAASIVWVQEKDAVGRSMLRPTLQSKSPRILSHHLHLTTRLPCFKRSSPCR